MWWPLFAQMMRGIETMVDKADKFTIVMSGNHDAARERHAIQALLQRQCDALILHSKALPDEELSELVAGNTPIVFINRQVPGAEDRCVWLDNQAGITTACQHLLDAGHSKIAFVTSDDEEFVDGLQRMAGYRYALQRAGIELDPALIGRAFADENGGYVAMGELLERGVEFTAVLGFNDAMVAEPSPVCWSVATRSRSRSLWWVLMTSLMPVTSTPSSRQCAIPSRRWAAERPSWPCVCWITSRLTD